MPSPGSVSHWIVQLKAGEKAAAEQLWERYFRRLVGLARKKLRGTRRRAADEEDVALSAFDNFCRGARDGKFPRLSDRDNLWQLLVVITARKALHLVQHEHRQKRGGGAVRGESALLGPDGSSGEAGIEQVIGQQPTPAFAAEVAEEYHRRLDTLDRDDLRAVAVLKMEGHTNAEIAVKLGCVEDTVGRKLRLIRKLWKQGSTE
ncbi:MAG TPA: ECF-type sigma factor [Gemmataceae bacterium]|nr:ECF-type sigma factor [Gemmataceae bacterium]